MKAIKKFYCYITDGPIGWSFLVILLIFFILHIILLAINGTCKGDEIIKSTIPYFTVSFVIFALINKVIVNTKITYLKDEYYLEITLLHLPKDKVDINL